MSKAYAMAGLRIGWLATPRPRAARPGRGVQGLHDDLLVGALGGPRDHRPARAAIACWPGRAGSSPRTSSVVDAFFEDWADRFSWVRPRAGSIGYPRLTVPGVRIDDWAAELVETEGVLLLPGSQFGHPGNHFRIGFGRTDLPEALDRLEAYARRTLR